MSWTLGCLGEEKGCGTRVWGGWREKNTEVWFSGGRCGRQIPGKVRRVGAGRYGKLPSREDTIAGAGRYRKVAFREGATLLAVRDSTYLVFSVPRIEVETARWGKLQIFQIPGRVVVGNKLVWERLERGL